ncbi:uncharacterized protein LOC144645671 [Oculina patagonica]
MSHLYSSQQIRSSRATRSEGLSYERNFPHFDLSSRAVKLPPIIKNELLVSRGPRSCRPSYCSTARSKANLNVTFPKITEPQPQKSWSGTASHHRVASQHKTENKQGTIKHVEKTPIRFPNSYTVLPPIGKTSSWQAHNGFSSLQAPSSPRNGVQAPISIQDQIKGRRRSSQRKRSDNGLSPSPNTKAVEKESVKTTDSSSPARNNENVSTAIENRNQSEKPTARASDTNTTRSSIDTVEENIFPCLSDEEIQMTECDPVRHILEKLELSKEAQEFLESELSKRRKATCIEIDASLKKAVDIIRDNLLRQTMEELCMMW